MKKLFIVISLLMLSGCVSTTKPKSTEFDYENSPGKYKDTKKISFPGLRTKIF